MTATLRFRLISLIAFTIILTSLIAVWRWLLVDLPDPNQLYQYAAAPPTNIYDRNGVLLYQITDPHQGYHTPLTLDEIPAACVAATIATEDQSFYTNPGFDTRGMVRALVGNIRAGQIVSGASTITQQLARNLLFSPAERAETSLTRKLREIILAWRMTQTYNKDQILTLYLNETYYGNLAHGLQAAANVYFGKSAADLDLAECALLAGLPQSPVYYNPLDNLDAAKARQADVLNLMAGHGVITADQADQAAADRLQFAAIPFPIKAPHFVMYVRGQVERRFGREALYTQGLQIYTTVDVNVQNAAQQAVQHRLADLAAPKDHLPPRNVNNAAVVVLDNRNGEVLAMLGSPDYFDATIAGNVNVAVANRQPGSAIKPLTYAAAFDPAFAQRYGYEPLTPASMMVDVRTSFTTKEGRPYVPQNYDRRWHGPVLLRQALAASLNLVAVKVLDHVGLPAMTDLARQLGITTFDDVERFGLALTLGGGEVRLLSLTSAYAALATGGYKVEPVTIRRIETHRGEVVYQRPPLLTEPVIDSRAAWLITDILSDNLARADAFGEWSVLNLDRPVAAKTGTTTDFRDNWTIGYSPQLSVGVWAGNADNSPMRHVSGITGAGPIWHDVMLAIHQGVPVVKFPQPDGLVQQTICAVNGLRPSEGCRLTREEWFLAGTEPTAVDTWHQQVAIDRRNGLLAENCPPAETVQRWFTIYPVEADPWVSQLNTRRPPTQVSPLCEVDQAQTQRVSASASTPLQLIAPDHGSVYHVSPTIPVDQQQIRVTALASSQVQPDSIQLLVNGTPLAPGDDALWTLQPGDFRFEAIGVDQTGKLVRSAVEVTVK